MSEGMEVGPGTERDYVSLGRRFGAAVIDNVFWVFLWAFYLGGVVTAAAGDSTVALGVILIAYFSIWFNYFSFAEWRWGQTMGKNAMGIMVTTTDGDKLTFGQASLRNLLRLIDWLVIGWVMIASTDRKQRLGDKAAGSVVVRRPARTGTTMKPAPEVLARQVAGGSVGGPAPEGPAPGGPAPVVPMVPVPPVSSVASDLPPGHPAPLDESPKLKRPGIRGLLPEITWTLKDTIWGLIGGLLLAIIAPALVLPFDSDPDSGAALLVAQALFGLCLIAVPFGIASGWRPSGLGAARERLGLRRFDPSAIGWMFLTLFGYYVFAAVFATLVLQPEQEDIGGELGVGDESLIIAIAAVVLIAVVAPITEEIFFRGFFFSGLRSRLSVWPAALITGLVFGSVHAPTGITAVVPLAVLGMGLCWLYNKTGSLWPCIIAHLLNNALALLLIS